MFTFLDGVFRLFTPFLIIFLDLTFPAFGRKIQFIGSVLLEMILFGVCILLVCLGNDINSKGKLSLPTQIKQFSGYYTGNHYNNDQRLYLLDQHRADHNTALPYRSPLCCFWVSAFCQVRNITSVDFNSLGISELLWQSS